MQSVPDRRGPEQKKRLYNRNCRTSVATTVPSPDHPISTHQWGEVGRNGMIQVKKQL